MMDASKKGIPYETILKHCKGERNMGLRSILRYEQLLGISRFELLPDFPSPTPPEKEAPHA